MALFADSTHRQRWLYTPEKLEARRAELHRSAFTPPAPEEGSDAKRPASEGSAGEAGSSGQTDQAGAAPEVTRDEVRKLLRFYEGRVAQVCKECRLPKKVQATALVYFKRVYLTQSVLVADPFRTLLTCLYIAGKVEESYICAEELCTHVEKVMPGIALAHSQVEESYISAEELAAAIPVKPAMILQNEISVYTALNCDLVVWSPYRALAGLLMDIDAMRAQLQDASDTLPVDQAVINMPEDLYKGRKAKAEANLDTLMLSDAPLLLPPSVLALSALREAFRGKVEGKLMGYMSRVVTRSNSVQTQEENGQGQGSVSEPSIESRVSALMSLLDQANALGVQAMQEISKDDATEIDKKLKQWKALTAGDANAQQAAEAKARAEKREAKVKARKAARDAQEAALLGMPQQPNA